MATAWVIVEMKQERKNAQGLGLRACEQKKKKKPVMSVRGGKTKITDKKPRGIDRSIRRVVRIENQYWGRSDLNEKRKRRERCRVASGPRRVPLVTWLASRKYQKEGRFSLIRSLLLIRKSRRWNRDSWTFDLSFEIRFSLQKIFSTLMRILDLTPKSEDRNFAGILSRFSN